MKVVGTVDAKIRSRFVKPGQAFRSDHGMIYVRVSLAPGIQSRRQEKTPGAVFVLCLAKNLIEWWSDGSDYVTPVENTLLETEKYGS